MKNQFITIRANAKLVKQLKSISKQMKVSQRIAIEIALMELQDLLRQYPQVDYSEKYGKWLLRRP
jgi:hypothetical protein